MSGSAATSSAPDAGSDPALDASADSVTESTRGDAGAAQQVSYQRDVQPIWDKYCNNCHNFHTPHLVGTSSWSMLIGAVAGTCNQVPLVVPGNPEASFLYAKLTGVIDFPASSSCGRPMPADWMGMGDTPLADVDASAVQTVQQWIAQGALNN